MKTVNRRDLLETSLPELMAAAAAARYAQFGTRVTFSPKVFIPLTMLCRDRCGYCTFAKPPARLAAPYLSLDEVLAIARRGAELGCHEALFTLGEAPEDRYPVAGDWLAAHGYDSTVDYLVAACAAGRCWRSALLTTGTVTCRRSSSRTSCPSPAPRCGATARATVTSCSGRLRRRASCSVRRCTCRRRRTCRNRTSSAP